MSRFLVVLALLTNVLFAEINLSRSTLGWITRSDVLQARAILLTCKYLRDRRYDLTPIKQIKVNVFYTDKNIDVCGYSYKDMGFWNVVLTKDAFFDEGCYQEVSRATLAHELLHSIGLRHKQAIKYSEDFIYDEIETIMYECYEKRIKGHIFSEDEIQRFEDRDKLIFRD